MNDTSTPTTTTEFVWRRLQEPLRFLGNELPSNTWLFLLGGVLAFALVYVVWMYVKDSRTVGAWWGTLLGLLRTGVYAILAVVFLLPARQTTLESSTKGKVVVIFDVSSSMHTSDSLPTSSAKEGQGPTRQDLVLDFLKNPKIKFFAGLEEKNPLTVYRFGNRLDEDYLHLEDARVFFRTDKEKPERTSEGKIVLPEQESMALDCWTAWLNPHQWREPQQQAVRELGLNSINEKRMQRLIAQNEVVFQTRMLRGTNIADSLLGVLSREANSRLQGIVVVTDGRDTERSANAFRELAQRAKASSIPIFVVGVGEDHKKVKIEVVDVLAPQQIQPQDRYRVKAEVTGEGLPGEKLYDVEKDRGKKPYTLEKDGKKTAHTVHLTVSHVKLAKSKEKDGKTIEKEEKLPLYLVEGDDPNAPPGESVPKSEKRDKIFIGNQIVLKPNGDVTLDKSSPPRVEIEWQLDAKTLLAGRVANLVEQLASPNAAEKQEANKQLDLIGSLALEPLRAERDTWRGLRDDTKQLKETRNRAEDIASRISDALQRIETAGRARPKIELWGLGETGDDSDIKFQLTVPQHPGERLAKKPHDSNKVSMKVIKRPLRILLVAAAGGREYQFIRSLLVREMDRKVLDVAIHLQLPPGTVERKPGLVQDVPANKLLSYFPDSFKKKKDQYDLSSYDVIIAFDPDWTQLGTDQIKMIEEWVNVGGGGLVLIGGHINTYQLVRYREGEEDRYKPIKDLLPVVLDDIRRFPERDLSEPWALDLGDANRDLEFLRLDETADASKPRDDWKAFFYGPDEKARTDKPERGFFSFYPVKRALQTSIVAARFTAPNTKDEEGKLHPYIVLTADDLPRRVIWIGSMETWRLREYREEYHERFWAKLIRYAAAKSKGAVARPIRLEAARSCRPGATWRWRRRSRDRTASRWRAA